MQAVAAQDCCRRALDEMLRYLDDEIAPFAAADSFEVLLHSPPEIGAQLIDRWLARRSAPAGEPGTIAARLHHAVRKLHDFASFELLHRPLVERYVTEISRLVVARCPAAERAELNRKLAPLGQVETVLSHAVEVLQREKESAAQGAPGSRALPRPPPAASAALRPGPVRGGTCDGDGAERRLNVILRRMHEDRAASKEDLLAHLLAKAILAARDDGQLQAFLRRLPDLGVGVAADRGLFRLLGDRLPAWDFEPGEAAPAFESVSHLLRAMRRAVTLAHGEDERQERFEELVHAAVAKLNASQLAQAAAMLALAGRLAAEREIDPAVAASARERARAALDLTVLRQALASPQNQRLLRQTLEFFPDLSAESLLARLDGEPKRETRKWMLALVEAHGPAARPKVFARLHGYLGGGFPDPKGYYRRNAIYLLRRIPHAPSEDAESELALLADLARHGQPFLVAREAVEALGSSEARGATRALLDGLDALEGELLAGRRSYPEAQAFELLDRYCAALARRGGRDATRRVVRHAFQEDSKLGKTLDRIAHLRECDLAPDPEQLHELIAFVERATPRRILGVALAGATVAPRAVVHALSGTTAPAVERLLAELAAREDGEPAAAARTALARRKATFDPGARLQSRSAGELERFGLPGLLQSLGAAGSTGKLALFDGNATERGRVVFRAGKITACEVASLRGLDALCQLIERPRAGTYRFERALAEAKPDNAPALEVLPALLEAIRRHAELEADRALVPDGAEFHAGRVPPSLPPGEDDPALVRTVWQEASSGATPERCEASVRADACRVRRLYVHWFEQGSLAR